MVPLWALFSFFFLLVFSTVFLFFFLLFMFSFFLIFFISSFFDFFNVFHFLFSFFPKKKFLLFFFLVFLSNIFFLLALVSEFNCFLGSRCSMEMWCPDDTGRDSWDWVGRVLGREHASTHQSGVEAPRLLKRSLPRLYCCCCVYCVCCACACGCGGGGAAVDR